MPARIQDIPSETEQDLDSAHGGLGSRVVLFNCNCHTFEDVENQLMKAIRCPLSKARSISWQVHSQGSAVVYSGTLERCEAVAAVLEDIRLIVKVTQ